MGVLLFPIAFITLYWEKWRKNIIWMMFALGLVDMVAFKLYFYIIIGCSVNLIEVNFI